VAKEGSPKARRRGRRRSCPTPAVVSGEPDPAALLKPEKPLEDAYLFSARPILPQGRKRVPLRTCLPHRKSTAETQSVLADETQPAWGFDAILKQHVFSASSARSAVRAVRLSVASQLVCDNSFHRRERRVRRGFLRKRHNGLGVLTQF